MINPICKNNIYCQIYLSIFLFIVFYFYTFRNFSFSFCFSLYFSFLKSYCHLWLKYKYKFLCRWDGSCALFPLLDADIDWESSLCGFLSGLLFTCIPSKLSYLSKRSMMSHTCDNAMQCKRSLKLRFSRKYLR